MTRPGKTGTADTSEPLYGEQTRLAMHNFTIGAAPMPADFIHALGLIKAVAARVNGDLGLLAPGMARAIEATADEVAAGHWDRQFPVGVYQTGSGTSSNMNANEVIATLATRRCGLPVHPNDHVNLGQSSNDVIPTAIHLGAALRLQPLKAALEGLYTGIGRRAEELARVVKTGRTHLMDAVPMTLGQELSGWASLVVSDLARLSEVEARLLQLAQGGTAVGTGLNAHAEFSDRFAAELGRRTGLPFRPAGNRFAAIGAQNTAVELSGQLRVCAGTLLKIANDLRWMNSGPLAGLAELQLPELQAGSSIMPGKVNPVIPEAVGMACVQVMGLDVAVALAAGDNRFQLATMLPLIAANLLQQLSFLEGAARSLNEQAIARFIVNVDRLAAQARRNAMLATALNPRIGYELAGRIAKAAREQDRALIDVAREMSGLPEAELQHLLDPLRMALNDPAGAGEPDDEQQP